MNQLHTGKEFWFDLTNYLTENDFIEGIIIGSEKEEVENQLM